MAGRRKLEKFAEVNSFPNVLENKDPQAKNLFISPDKTIDLKGSWNQDFFKNSNPIVLELACGYGEYAVEMARQNPDKNYIGIDVKGNRIWRGAKTGLEENLDNLGFLRSRIEIIDAFFAPDEIDTIWITFPDPFLKKGKENRRLTAPYFLDVYRSIIRPDGDLYLKTDSRELYDFTLEVFEEEGDRVEIIHRSEDIYAEPSLYRPELAIKTRYEKIHSDLGKTIKMIHFTLPSEEKNDSSPEP